MKKTKGVSAKIILVPFIILIGILAGLSVFFASRVTLNNNKLIRDTEDYLALSVKTSQMQSGSDNLTYNARHYVSTGQTSYLDEYFKEYHEKRTRENALESVRAMTDDISVLKHVSDAMEQSTELAQIEFYAMRLRAAADVNDLSKWPDLLSVTLTAEHRGLLKEEKITAACLMLMDETYEEYKYNIRTHLNDASLSLRTKFMEQYNEYSALLKVDQWVLWGILVALVIGIIYVSYVVLSVLIAPLVGFRKDIDAERAMRVSGSKELRILASSYNELLERRKNLEAELRYNAETDTLTGLPNRLAMTYFLDELTEAKPGYPLAIISLDLNDLKPTNDTLGHSHGDELLQNAADCIKDVFADPTGRNCYRFGGDEFAVFLIKVSEEQVQNRIRKFREQQPKYGVSVAVGYAYTENASSVVPQELFDRADQNMYVDKARIKLERKKPPVSDRPQ